MAPQNFAITVSLASALSSLSGGCAWRSGGVEHYLGPVSFRHVSPPTGRAYVSQVVRWGLSTEGGSSWGISVGMSERISVAPVASAEKTGLATRRPRWTSPLSAAGMPAENEWHLSLLYLRVEDVPPPMLVSRTVFGAEAVAGQEVSAFTVGLATRTLSMAPANAFSTLHFESARPMEARAELRSDPAVLGFLPDESKKDVTQ